MQRETDRAVPQLLPSSSATTIHRGSMGNPNDIHRNGPPLFGKGADVGLSESRYADVRVPGPSSSGAGDGGPAGMPHMVPQLKASPISQQPLPRGLTKAQQSELEMARRRAQKAAEGKAANAAVSRRVKRKAQEDDDDDDMSHMQNEEIEAKLASITDVKEAKRLKRLLRNRVSAQQARERKKSYVSNLEQRAREQEQTITEMEQRVIKLERENAMLRSVMKNMQPTSAPSAYMQQGNFGGVPQGPAGGYGTRLDNFGF